MWLGRLISVMLWGERATAGVSGTGPSLVANKAGCWVDWLGPDGVAAATRGARPWGGNQKGSGSQLGEAGGPLVGDETRALLTVVGGLLCSYEGLATCVRENTVESSLCWSLVRWGVGIRLIPLPISNDIVTPSTLTAFNPCEKELPQAKKRPEHVVSSWRCCCICPILVTMVSS